MKEWGELRQTRTFHQQTWRRAAGEGFSFAFAFANALAWRKRQGRQSSFSLRGTLPREAFPRKSARLAEERQGGGVVGRHAHAVRVHVAQGGHRLLAVFFGSIYMLRLYLFFPAQFTLIFIY